MRIAAMVLAAAGLMLSASVQAGPLTLPGAAPAAGAAVSLIAGGCGPGFHPRTYRDRRGRLFTECVPAGPPVYAPVRRCAPGWHWRRWVDRFGRVHGECVP